MNSNIITGIYPGTFDPVTLGHLDIIFRATHIVNKLIISVAKNVHKRPFLSLPKGKKSQGDQVLVQKGFDQLP